MVFYFFELDISLTISSFHWYQFEVSTSIPEDVKEPLS